MPALLELQRDFAHSILQPDQAAGGFWVVEDGIPPLDRIGIYRNTATGVLAGALRISYPAVERLVGAEFFAGAARIFLERGFPRGAYLNDFGGGFPEFLAGFAPAAGLPYLADVAALEWAVAGAANAPDAPALDPAALAGLGGAELERLRLVPHPSLRILELGHAADTIWESVLAQDDAALGRIRLDAARFALLVYRGGDGIRLRRLSAPEHHLTAALCAGRPVAPALAASGDADAVSLLAEHFATGRFTGFELIDAAVQAKGETPS